MTYKFGEEYMKTVIMNIINIQENLHQLCLCGLTALNLLECVQFRGLYSIFINGSYVSDEVLMKISTNSPLLRDLILSDTVTNNDTKSGDDESYDFVAYHSSYRGNQMDSYSNIGVAAILQNCTALESLELGGNQNWTIDSLLNKDMFRNMSCFNLRRVALGNLEKFDDDAIKVLCDNIHRLEEFIIDEESLTTTSGIVYLAEKFSGSLTVFIDNTHRFSKTEISNFAITLSHINEFEVWFDESNFNEIKRSEESLTTNFKEICTSKELKRIKIICPYWMTDGRPHSLLSFWDSVERRVEPDDNKIHKYGLIDNNNDDNSSMIMA